MRNVRFKIGTTVVIRSPLDSSAELGQIVAGPLDISGDIFFKVRTMDYDAWHPVEHIYRRKMDHSGKDVTQSSADLPASRD